MTTSMAAIYTTLATASAEEAGRSVGRLLVVVAIIALIVWLVRRARR